MEEMTGNFMEKAKRAGAVSGVAMRLLAVVLIALMVATAGGCGKGGGISVSSIDQTDPKKFAQGVATELLENRNGKVLEKYASYELKKEMERTKANIEYSRKAGWGDGKDYIEAWVEKQKNLDNKWGKVVSYGILNIEPVVKSDSRELLEVRVWIIREHFKMEDGFTKQHACKGISEEECKKKFSWRIMRIIKEHDGKWYIQLNGVA